MQTKVERSGIRGLADAVVRRWWLALCVAVPLFAGVVVYTEALPAQYEATSIVSFSPRAAADVGADVIRLTLPRYTVFATSPQVLTEVAATTGVDEADVKGALDAKIQTDTANIAISATGTDPETAARVANAAAADVVAFAETDTALRARVVSIAVPPVAAVGPPRMMIELAGLVVAVLAGLGAALAAERLFPKIASAGDVSAIVRAPVLGRLPVTPRIKSIPALQVPAADAVVASAVRTLRTGLLVQLPPEPGVAVMVTSTLPREGKTTIATWLAASLASVRDSVLLIDGDMVHPAVAAATGVSTERHIGEVLDGSAWLTNAVQPTTVPGLDVLAAVADPKAGDQLTVGFHSLLEQARKSYAVIVVDAPPVLGSDVGQTIATQVDRCLFVSSIGSPQRKVSAAVDVLDLVEAQVAGVVVNRLPKREAGPYTSYATRE